MSKKDFFLFGLIFVAILSRLLFLKDGVSMLPNFTAIGAVALFGAAYLGGSKKWFLPLAALWITDLLLNNTIYAQYYDNFQIMGNLWVYGSIVLIGVMAMGMLRKKTWSRLALTSIAGAVVFFIITNFGSWIGGAMYPTTVAGLMECYTAGIPFFRNTLLGNLFYTFLLFGVYEFIAQRMDILEPMFSCKKVAAA